jgi:hypothetical protein
LEAILSIYRGFQKKFKFTDLDQKAWDKLFIKHIFARRIRIFKINSNGVSDPDFEVEFTSYSCGFVIELLWNFIFVW